jgi:hypothetical protein
MQIHFEKTKQIEFALNELDHLLPSIDFVVANQ